ncbi:hypothetical protein [Cognatilysobacter bugurensis]|uniref:DUF1269 domain-containing protein n=1 Tax=Cognatilysobacter bugurensis TaxID=543356 RepID=A0A918T284_9GAMM|nr:hypothetical protein [Lysobacter bugurensis]GHA83625.1 hypothetical protein GCM10007067_22180 [Lysobacter bugurensis]
MKTRHVFSTPDVTTAARVVEIAFANGATTEDLSLVARSDIELDAIPDELKSADSDFMPAVLRGMGAGTTAGLLAGLVAVVATPIGVTLAGAAAVAAGGAALGGWTSSIVGGALPDPIRRDFDDEIKASRILVVVDGTKDVLAELEPRLVEAGARRLPWEETTAFVR